MRPIVVHAFWAAIIAVGPLATLVGSGLIGLPLPIAAYLALMVCMMLMLAADRAVRLALA